MDEKRTYRTIAISCKAKDLLDEIAKAYAVNRGKFVEKLIEKQYRNMIDAKQ
jgi:hypothetical protein